MKLMSNTSFGELCKSKEKEFKTRLEYLEWYEKVRNNFDDFLKQPLTFGMFIKEAKERVLFKGFEYNSKIEYWHNDIVSFDEEYIHNKTIEDLVEYNLDLTDSEIKQLGL